ncbi:MAG TPA: hypothetical protein VK899_07115 [Gemmatimonadales bacterium]|nr:hypothetical protein [Gemmatimonadales bacterium]
MELVEPVYFYHVGCIPLFPPIQGMRGMSEYDLGIKEDVIEVVRWADANRARSKQVALGCSEVGHQCDRRLAYRIAGVDPGGYSNDPWPAVVGTAVHSWMEEAVRLFQEAHGLDHWVTEMEVLPSPIVKGHTDLYDARRHLVLDWKFPSPDNLRKMREDGIPSQYQTQVQLYGLGHVNAGRKVERVGIVALGRQGWLKDAYVWTTEFDIAAANAAINRIYSIGNTLMDADLSDPAVWQAIPAVPTRLCSWCPWHRREKKVADEKGCPGK